MPAPTITTSIGRSVPARLNVLMLVALAAATALAAPAALPQRIEAGHSVNGRKIVAVRTGPSNAPVRILVSGSIHGTEPAGHAVIARLRKLAPPTGVQVWTVRDLQPRRGRARHPPERPRRRPQPQLPLPLARRRSALRRLLPGAAARRPSPRRRPQMRLIRRIRPQLSIHFHQALRLVNLTGAPRPQLVRDYAERTGLPAKRLPYYRGTSTSWQNHTFRDSTAFVVEFGGGALSEAQVRRHARAVLATARSLAPRRRRPGRQAADPVVADPVRRHPGAPDARLRPPPLRPEPRPARSRRRSIVEHFTASSTYAPGVQHLRRRTRPTSSSASGPACARTSSSTATGRSTSSSG